MNYPYQEQQTAANATLSQAAQQTGYLQVGKPETVTDSLSKLIGRLQQIAGIHEIVRGRFAQEPQIGTAGNSIPPSPPPTISSMLATAHRLVSDIESSTHALADLI